MEREIRIIAIIQARMSSQRLPGKVLRQLAGRPMLQHLIDRLDRSATLDGIVVATSDDASDEAIAEYCRRVAVCCERGPLDDVVGRFLAVIHTHAPDGFVRVCADSPLLDHRLVDEAVSRFRAGEPDLVTNISPRTYPSGQSVEVLSARTFEQASEHMSDPLDREHVTRYFYRNEHRFRIDRMVLESAGSRPHLAVDSEEDLRRVEALIGAMGPAHPDLGLQEILRLHAEITGAAAP